MGFTGPRGNPGPTGEPGPKGDPAYGYPGTKGAKVSIDPSCG